MVLGGFRSFHVLVTTHVHPLTGLIRAIMETMLHGSQFYMLFKEAFHIYGSFFETNKDEQSFRDILLHPETGLNVVIVTHPVTLERFVVLNKNRRKAIFN